MGRLFGTDGVRGIANQEITCDLATKIGEAGAYVLTSDIHCPRILVGSDTRKSSGMLCAALSAGICSVGGDVISVGVMPTPAMAHLVRLFKADAAVMVSASHNPMEYNGIKWFDGKGYKLSDELEDRIERIIQHGGPLIHPTGNGVGTIIPAKRAEEEYIDFLFSTSALRLDGLKIVLDCANGASSYLGERIFSKLGAQVCVYDNEPDGCNINDHCGSMHPYRIQQLVTALGADAGFAFDGDADRVIAADERGNIVDGDRILGISAQFLKAAGKLSHNTLVVTVMSNLGLKNRMKELGIAVEETAVGDRYVLENMLKNGYSLGGEQSGHVIFLAHNTTGDGMLTAIQLLNIVKASGKKLSALADDIPIYPQVLVNVIVENEKKQAIQEDDDLLEAIEAAKAELGESGRILVRASGTEPLIRIMLEGLDPKEIERIATAIANLIVEKYNGKIK